MKIQPIPFRNSIVFQWFFRPVKTHKIFSEIGALKTERRRLMQKRLFPFMTDQGKMLLERQNL